MTDGNTWDWIESLDNKPKNATLPQRAFDRLVAKRQRQLLKGCSTDTQAFWASTRAPRRGIGLFALVANAPTPTFSRDKMSNRKT